MSKAVIATHYSVFLHSSTVNILAHEEWWIVWELPWKLGMFNLDKRSIGEFVGGWIRPNLFSRLWIISLFRTTESQMSGCRKRRHPSNNQECSKWCRLLYLELLFLVIFWRSSRGLDTLWVMERSRVGWSLICGRDGVILSPKSLLT